MKDIKAEELLRRHLDKKNLTNEHIHIAAFMSCIDAINEALTMRDVGVRSEQLFCENVIHQTCKYFDTYNGCMGCLVKNYEAK